jgi:hypothetical protein
MRVIREALMDQAALTNKKTANGIPPRKRSGKAQDDTSDTTPPVELQDLLQALRAMRAGDFSVRMGSEHDGLFGKIADTFNDIVASNQRMAQLARLSAAKAKLATASNSMFRTAPGARWNYRSTR